MPERESSGPSPGATAAERYAQLSEEREPYLRRARDAAALTLPDLMPPEGHDSGHDLPDPFQSVGARGVNNLAAKLLLSLFPPDTRSFFRLKVDDITMDALVERAVEKGMDPGEARSELEKAFAAIERAVVTRMEQKGVRSTFFEGMKHLLVPGNVLLQVMDDAAAKLHFLDSYVVKRDKSDKVLDIVVKETVARNALPREIREWAEQNQELSEEGSKERQEEFDIYTWIKRSEDGKQWEIHQEIGGHVIPGSAGTDPIDKPSFFPLRMTKVDGEDYGRGFVPSYLGDLKSLEALTQAIVEGSGAAARILIFVDESGWTSAEDVAEAPNGAVVPGRAQDVSVLQLDKFADFRIAQETAVRIEKRLEQDFLLMSSIQRNAERVTAEEIRTVANELEQALGGIYSLLAQEFQRPLVDRIIFQMQRKGDLPKLPDDRIQPQIVAGLEGLSRSSDLNKYRHFAAIMRETFGEQHLATFFNPTVFGNIAAAALGIEVDGLVRSEKEVAQIQAQAQEAQLVQKMGPALVKGMSDAAQNANNAPAQ